MKIKYLLFIILLISSIYLIYNKNYKKEIDILSINSLNKEEDYNPYLSKYLEKSKINYKFNIDYSNELLEIENLIALIDKNDKEIQRKIHSSNIIILSIGNVDMKTENYKVILQELKELFKKLRTINTKEIIYISPTDLISTTLIKELCHKYNIIFINGHSFDSKNELLAQMIYRKIDSQYNTNDIKRY